MGLKMFRSEAGRVDPNVYHKRPKASRCAYCKRRLRSAGHYAKGGDTIHGCHGPKGVIAKPKGVG